MKKILMSSIAANLFLRLTVACLTPEIAYAAFGDAADFPSAQSRCMAVQKGRVITSVGNFPSLDHEDLEVVADTKLKMSASSATEFEHPSINIFNKNCDLIWRQSYPSLAEVGFNILEFPGRLMLHVSAISVFQPVDQVISDEELLSSVGDTLVCEISFGSDRYNASYVGPLSVGNEFGVIVKHNSTPTKVSMDAISPAITALVYRWRGLINPDNVTGPPGYLFVGPEQLQGKELTTLGTGLAPTHPPFPLYKFVFGTDYPG